MLGSLVVAALFVVAAVAALTAEQFLRPMGNSFGSVRDTLAHIYGAEQIWLDAQGSAFLGGQARALAGVDHPDARARFMSGLPALLAASALGLGGGAFALDAACASSLYAVKLACDRLHDRRADLMLAGAVNAADPLFLHLGFCALSAMSKSGRSRPFHADADGLVPAEGCAMLALQRLDDAAWSGEIREKHPADVPWLAGQVVRRFDAAYAPLLRIDEEAPLVGRTVQRVEADDDDPRARAPSVSVLERLAGGLGVPVAALVSDLDGVPSIVHK